MTCTYIVLRLIRSAALCAHRFVFELFALLATCTSPWPGSRCCCRVFICSPFTIEKMSRWRAYNFFVLIMNTRWRIYINTYYVPAGIIVNLRVVNRDELWRSRDGLRGGGKDEKRIIFAQQPVKHTQTKGLLSNRQPTNTSVTWTLLFYDWMIARGVLTPCLTGVQWRVVVLPIIIIFIFFTEHTQTRCASSTSCYSSRVEWVRSTRGGKK